MKRILKYVLHVEDWQSVQMYIGAKILTAQLQHGVIALWAEVDDSDSIEARYFRVIGTGNPFDNEDNKLKYVATVQQASGNLVWHIFEE